MLTVKKLILPVFVIFVAVMAVTANIQAKEEKKIMTQKAPVTLINPFTVPKDKLDEAIISWERARDFLKQQPGYISTKLHQSISPDAQYLLINVAEWETSDDFKAAIAAMRADSAFPPVEGVVPAPALYTVIRN